MKKRPPFDFDESDVEYDPSNRQYHLSFNPENLSRPITVVVQLVSYITGKSIFSLPQLYSTVDADSLDAWLSAAEESGMDIEVAFPYDGYQITLGSSGEVWVQPQNEISKNGDQPGIGN